MLHSEFHSAMRAVVSSFVVGRAQNPQKGDELPEDHMGNPLEVGAKTMIPPLMSCGSCCHCRHYPSTANMCLPPAYYRRHLGFDEAPHLWGG